MKIDDVRSHLLRQHDVTRATVIKRDGKFLVRARVENDLHDGTTLTRVCYYDEEGEKVNE